MKDGRGAMPTGVIVAEVTDEELGASDLVGCLGGPSDGAVVAFEGRVRNHSDGRVVVRLHYDAYREMADAVLREIAEEAVARSGATAIGVRHRVGSLDPGTVSLVVVAAAPHRRPAFDACTRVIEELKRRLPLWKREEYADGTSRWLEGHSPAVEGRESSPREAGDGA